MGNILPFFGNYFEYAETLPTEQRLAFYDAVMRYTFRGEEPPSDSPAYGAFMLVKSGIDKSVSMSERGRAGGLAGRGTTRNLGNSNAAKKKQNKSKTKAENNTESKAENNTETIPNQKQETIRKQNEDENEDEYTRTKVRVKTRARARIDADFLKNAAAALGIPRDYAAVFEEIMRTQDWAYVNPNGRTVPVTLGNVKTVMGSFWRREKERRKEGETGGDVEFGGDELRAIVARTRK